MSRDAERVTAWRQEFAATGAWVRGTSRIRMVVPTLLSVAMALISLAIVVQGSLGALVVGGLGVLVFGVWFLPTVVWRAVTGRPELRLDRAGLVNGPVAVPWSEVVGVGFFGRGTSRTVVVRLTPAGGALVRRQGSLPGRLLRRLSDRLVGGPSVGIPNGYGVRPDLLAAWIGEVRAQARWPR